MNKKLKIFLIITAGLAIVLIAGFKYMQYSTKQHSPEQFVTVSDQNLKVDVFYNSPSMRDRKIFGGLVPYGEVWRTGANEPTTITFNSDVIIDGKELGAGTYSLWTVPGEAQWEVIFNSGEYGWGVSWGGKASHDPTFDALRVRVTPEYLDKPAERLAIDVKKDPLRLEMAWENTRISLPINREN